MKTKCKIALLGSLPQHTTAARLRFYDLKIGWTGFVRGAGDRPEQQCREDKQKAKRHRSAFPPTPGAATRAAPGAKFSTTTV